MVRMTVREFVDGMLGIPASHGGLAAAREKLSAETPEEKETLDVPGLIRRVRREADLSQRELAHLLGVCQPTVVRWESGAAEPGIGQFQRLLIVAGLRLAVLDAEGAPSQPMRQDGPRDKAGRRAPAHLDTYGDVGACTGEALVVAPRRSERDRRRRAAGGRVPFDHGTAAEYAEARLAPARERLRRAAEARRPSYQAFWDALPPCCCLDACEESARCLTECPCGCEGWEERAGKGDQPSMGSMVFEAPSMSSMTPEAPSMRTRWPSTSLVVASWTPTIAGMPYSRATTDP